MSDVTLPPLLDDEDDEAATVAEAPKKRARAAAKSDTTPIPPVTRKPRKPLPPIDVNCPPMQVRDKESGVVTNWSSLFKKQVGRFDYHFRSAEEEQQYRIKRKRYEAKQAMDGYVDPETSAFGDDDD